MTWRKCDEPEARTTQTGPIAKWPKEAELTVLIPRMQHQTIFPVAHMDKWCEALRAFSYNAVLTFDSLSLWLWRWSAGKPYMWGHYALYPKKTNVSHVWYHSKARKLPANQTSNSSPKQKLETQKKMTTFFTGKRETERSLLCRIMWSLGWNKLPGSAMQWSLEDFNCKDLSSGRPAHAQSLMWNCTKDRLTRS